MSLHTAPATAAGPIHTPSAHPAKWQARAEARGLEAEVADLRLAELSYRTGYVSLTDAARDWWHHE